MKKLLDKWISISLIKRIIGGLALGIILGLLVPMASGIALFGSVFVGALKAIAPLLVFVLVISSLCHSGKSHGGVIKTVIILYMFSTIRLCNRSIYKQIISCNSYISRRCTGNVITWQYW